MNRRNFLKTIGFFTALASFKLSASSLESVNFIHGVASGDPTEDKIILWSRVTSNNKANVQVTYEIYAKNIRQSDFYAFLEIENFIIDTKNNIVVDTSEEKLKAEFLDAKKTLIPINAVIRIDEVAEIGKSKISKSDIKSVSTIPFDFSEKK